MENDVLYLNGLKAGAYNGTLEGDVSYDIVTLLAKAKVKGKGIDADSAVSAFMNIKGQLWGADTTLFFKVTPRIVSGSNRWG